MLNKFEIYGIAALVLLLAIGGAYLKGRHDGTEARQEKWDLAIAAQAEKEREQANKAVTKLEDGNGKARVVYKTITQTVDKIVDRPVYRSVCLEPDGLLLANQALAGSLAAPAKPDAAVPRPDAPLRRYGIFGTPQTGGSEQPVLRVR